MAQLAGHRSSVASCFHGLSLKSACRCARDLGTVNEYVCAHCFLFN